MSTPNLVAFAHARLVEDEQAARAAIQLSGRRGRPGEGVWRATLYGTIADHSGEILDRPYDHADIEDHVQHAVRQNPAVTLARAAALSHLVDVCAPIVEHGLNDDAPMAETALRHVANIYRLRPDGTVHPDWRAEWAT